MSNATDEKKILEAFLFGLKLGQVLDCQVDLVEEETINLLIPATLEGRDKTDHFGTINFDSLRQHGSIATYFDTFDERLQYAVQGCSQEAYTEAGMSLDTEWWEAKRAASEKEDHPSH
jgi:hypothetical protein